jgi:putative spermidine/putrescine transport system permease protein
MIGLLLAAFPYSVIFFSGFWNARTKSLEELAAMLGSTRITTYAKVLLPIAKDVLVVCFFQTFLLSWFEYGLTSIIGVGKVQTLTVLMYQYISEANVAYAAISSLAVMLPPIIFIWFNKRFIITRLS